MAKSTKQSLKSTLEIATPADREIKQLRADLAAAKAHIERQAERIERLSKKGWTIPRAGKSRRPTRDGFVRVIVTDTHGSAVNWEALRAVVRDIESLAPAEIIHLGDAIDCGGFLAQHHVWGYVAETEYTFENDIACANQALDEIQQAAPGARFDFLEGNHERRIETWCVTQSLRSKQDARYLNKLLGVESQLRFQERGINHYRQGVFYDGLSIAGTIRRGPCFFTHGTSHGKAAAQKMLVEFGANVVFGHVHKALQSTSVTVKEQEISAWCPGALCLQRPLWHHGKQSDWTLGYGLQIVKPDGRFLHVNVPVIGGESYLIHLLGDRRK